MGEAMLSALLNKQVAEAKSITVSDVSEPRRHYLTQKYAMKVTPDNRLAITGANVVVLAVKPQNLNELMPELNKKLKPDQLVLSIIAGKKIALLNSGLNHDCIVRAMPNTPAQIGQGMSMWTATDRVTGQQKDRVSAILGAMGKEIYVDDEKYLDMATAISGSGPAYFFLFAESLVKAAIHIGLPHGTAEKLVLQTMLGSAHLMQESGKPPAELRKMVTSPGGTTAEALLQFEKGEFNQLILKAVTAAYTKAKELGNR